MTKFSQLFVPRDLAIEHELGAAESGFTPSPDRAVQGDGAGEPGPSESSARLGEECEALRSLVAAAGSKLDEFEEAKRAFVAIVEPASRALRALEHEKTLNISLARKVGQLRAGCDVLQVNVDELEKKVRVGATERD